MRKVLITGCCGFIGANAAAAFSRKGWRVTGFDNCSRAGTERNREWLARSFAIETMRGDVKDADAVVAAVRAGFDVVLHLAGQTAVTTSVRDPRTDLDTNVGGTFNVLEAIRRCSPGTILLNASTNKVYGALTRRATIEGAKRFELADAIEGFDETTPLDFHSPYGCSKGSADQYVCDYARIYGLKTVCFRQSCIYGPRQWGIEDQGWLAWFTIAHVLGIPITIYGSGKQTRDVLFVDDLVDLYARCLDNIDVVAGLALNVGGGRRNTLSLLELTDHLRMISGRACQLRYADERPGDQRLYISNTARAERLTGWRPTVPPSAGIRILYEWVVQQEKEFRAMFASPVA